jgi:hypothetical protein
MNLHILKKKIEVLELCNSICKRFEVPQCFINGSMYAQGFKRCMECKVWLDSKDCLKNRIGRLLCPCCNSPIRNNPRSKKLMVVSRVG